MATLNYFDPGTGLPVAIDMSADGAVWVGPEAPTDPAYSLWIDTDDFSDEVPKDNRNRIINGDFSVNQRGFTSVAVDQSYNFDRWILRRGAGGTVSLTTQTPALGELPESTKAFARLASTGQSAASDYTMLEQRIESGRTLSGKTATVSFWAKAASGTPKVAVELAQTFGTGGSPSAEVPNLGNLITLSTAWTRYSVTITLPSIVGKTIGTTHDGYLGLYIWTSAGSSFNARLNSLGIQTATIDFWGVQVEEGVTSTAYEQKSYADELRACQRYFYRLYSPGAYAPFGIGSASGVANCGIFLTTPVRLRAEPNLTFSAANTFVVADYQGNSLVVTGIAKDVQTGIQNNILGLSITVASGLTSGIITKLAANNNTTAFIDISAEL